MADVIGPNSYLPGDIMTREIPEGTRCDMHPERLAVCELVGETDSFGSEVYYGCKECRHESRSAPPAVGTCDWCKTPNQPLTNKRDYEEGMCGPVYQICTSCKDRYERRQAEDYAAEYDEHSRLNLISIKNRRKTNGLF